MSLPIDFVDEIEGEQQYGQAHEEPREYQRHEENRSADLQHALQKTLQRQRQTAIDFSPPSRTRRRNIENTFRSEIWRAKPFQQS